MTLKSGEEMLSASAMEISVNLQITPDDGMTSRNFDEGPVYQV